MMTQANPQGRHGRLYGQVTILESSCGSYLEQYRPNYTPSNCALPPTPTTTTLVARAKGRPPAAWAGVRQHKTPVHELSKSLPAPQHSTQKSTSVKSPLIEMLG